MDCQKVRVIIVRNWLNGLAEAAYRGRNCPSSADLLVGRGDRRARWLFILIAATAVMAFAAAVSDEFNVWKTLFPEVEFAQNQWRVMLGESTDSCDGLSVKPNCPAHPDNPEVFRQGLSLAEFKRRIKKKEVHPSAV